MNDVVVLPDLPPEAHTPAYGEVDLTTCDREPIHIPGAIQPHGVLLALDATLDAIVTVSRNCDVALGMAPSVVLRSSPGDVLGDSLLTQLATWLKGSGEGSVLDARLDHLADGSLRDADVLIHVHRSGRRVIVEIEPRSGYAASSVAELTVRSSQEAMARLAQAGSVVELGERLVTEIRALIAFDRVMLYHFDPQWNGEVIAEDKRDDLNSFLGLHYPATDIPAQARRLYKVNLTRLIVDIAYEPVALEPVLDPETGSPLDLSHSTLRSVSPIHVEYLGHMGVSASMSISIMVNNELWGLVACHHYSGPHRPSHDARLGAGILGQVASQMFGDREQAELRDAALATRTRLATVSEKLTRRVSAGKTEPLEALLTEPGLSGMLHSQGVAAFYDDTLHTAGEVGSDDLMHRVSAALDDPYRAVTSTDSIHRLGLGEDPQVAGALRIRLTDQRWIMWTRPEQERFVDWGGDPTNKLLAAQEGPHVRLSPRRSFAKWRQVVRGMSLPWTPWQIEAAEGLSSHLTGLSLLHARDQIAMAESLQRSVMLDHAPQLTGIQVAARYMPASTVRLGGDWWDAFALPDQRVAMIIGDVAGHGIAAASAMVQIRTALRAYLVSGASPAESLDQLDHLMAQLFADQVASAIVVVVDTHPDRYGMLEIANAGHPPAVLNRGGDAEWVDEGHRPLLGLGIRAAETANLRVQPGDTVLLYTDGLVERRGSHLGESLERLRLACEGPMPQALEVWTDHLLAAEGSSAEDDTTLLTFRLEPLVDALAAT